MARLKVAAPVISLISSSDDDRETSILPPRPLPRATKENDNPNSTTTKKSSTSSSRPNAIGNSAKPVESLKPKASAVKSSSVFASKALTESLTDKITIFSSSPPPPSLPRPTDKATGYGDAPNESWTRPMPKIFGALSSDPILSQSSPPRRFLSSSPKPLPKPKPKPHAVAVISSDALSGEEFPSPGRLFNLRPGDTPYRRNSSRSNTGTPVSTTKFSAETQALLRRLQGEKPEIHAPPRKRRKTDEIELDVSEPDPFMESETMLPPRTTTIKKTATISKTSSRFDYIVDSDDIIPSSSAPPASQQAKRKGKLTEAEKETRKADREAAKLAKTAEKEALKEQKKLEKEVKLREKSESLAMATANKLKTSHAVTASEMIVYMSSEFHGSKTGTQLQTLLAPLGVLSEEYDELKVPGNVVKWKRAVTAEWDEEDDVFVPIPKDIRDEKHILIVLEAKSFVDLANDPPELGSLVARVKQAYPSCKPIFVVEALTKLVNKVKSSQSRAYAAEVRNRMQQGTGGKVRASKAVETVDEDKIEDALLRLQLVHGCLIHQTTSFSDTAEAISNYTQHISQIPYKHAKATLNSSTNFCMDVGQIRSGTDADDTFSKMLQCVHMSTEGVATSIQAKYPTVQTLFKAFVEGGDDLLKDLPITRNRAGTATGRALGPAMSRKIARVLTGTDEWEFES